MTTSALRVVTLNLWGATEPLERRLALAGRELAALAPDVVALQEVAPHPGGGTTADALGRALGLVVVRDDGEPGFELAVLARRPGTPRISALPLAGATPRRLLSVPVAGGAAWVHVTHLSYPLDAGRAREAEVVAVDAAARACDPNAVHVLCGDMNADPDSDEMRFLRGLTSLGGRRAHWQDAWLRWHPDEPGETWCMQTGAERARRSVDVDRRLDYIYVTTRERDGRGAVLACDRAARARDPDGLSASDHCGVLADVQIAPGTVAIAPGSP